MSRSPRKNQLSQAVKKLQDQIDQESFAVYRLSVSGHCIGLAALSHDEQHKALVVKKGQAALSNGIQLQSLQEAQEKNHHRAADASLHKPSADTDGSFPGIRYFESELQLAIARGKTCRMPTCVTLVSIDALTSKDQPVSRESKLFHYVADKIVARLHNEDTVFFIDAVPELGKKKQRFPSAGYFAIISPCTPLGKGKHRAERLRESVSKKKQPGSRNMPNCTVSIGIGIVFPDEDLTADACYLAALEQLLAAGKVQNKVCAESKNCVDLSCQVTVEERTQLFRFLQKG